MDFRMLVVMFGGFSFGVTQFSIPPAIDQFMTLYGASYAGISVLISAMLWSHALVQVPAGILTDRLGLRLSLLFSFIALSAGNFLPALAPSFGLAITGRVVTGLGTGFGFISLMKLVALYAPGRRIGVYQAYFATSHSVGSILVYLLMPALLVFTWRWAYVIAGICALISLLLAGFVKIDASGSAAAAPLHLKRVLLLRAGWVLGLIHTLAYGSIINFGNWIPSLLAEARRMDSAATLAWGGALVLFVSGIGRLGGGFFMYRIKPRSMIIGSILALFVTYVGLLFLHSATPVLILALVATLWASVSFGALFQMAAEATTPATIGTLFGLINMIANSGLVLFTLMFGWFKDVSGSFMGGFVVLGALTLTALIMGQKFLAREPRR